MWVPINEQGLSRYDKIVTTVMQKPWQQERGPIAHLLVTLPEVLLVGENCGDW